MAGRGTSRQLWCLKRCRYNVKVSAVYIGPRVHNYARRQLRQTGFVRCRAVPFQSYTLDYNRRRSIVDPGRDYRGPSYANIRISGRPGSPCARSIKRNDAIGTNFARIRREIARARSFFFLFFCEPARSSVVPSIVGPELITTWLWDVRLSLKFIINLFWWIDVHCWFLYIHFFSHVMIIFINSLAL